MSTGFRISISAALLCSLSTAAVALRPALRFEKNFGGTGTDIATAVASDRAGNTYVVGTTSSLDFPVSNAFQPKIGGALLRVSNDQGKTWLDSAASLPLYVIAASRRQPSVVFGGSKEGLLKSTDNGKTWSALAQFPSRRVSALIVSDINPDVVYAGTWLGTFKSQDGGATWEQIDIGIEDQFVVALVSNVARPATLFRVTELNGQGPGIYRTIDAGLHWSLLPNSPLGVFSMTGDPNNTDTFYAVAARLGFIGGGERSTYKTTDAGNTWTKLADLPEGITTFAIAASKAAIFVATDAGVLASRDGGTSWVRTGLQEPAYNLAVDPTDLQTIYAGTTGVIRSTDNGASWNGLLGARQNVLTIAVVATSPSTLYVGGIPGQNAFITKWSPDGTQMLYSSYLGGSYYDIPTGVGMPGRS